MNFPTKMPLIYRYIPKTVVRAVGPDAQSFLQGQFTQELRQLKDGQGAYGLWLNQKGKVLADSYIIRQSVDNYLLVSEGSPEETVLARLHDYLIADEVELVAETGAWEAWVGEPGAEVPIGTWRLGFPRGGDGVEWLGARTAEAVTDLASVEGQAWELRRVRAGWPRIPEELGEGDLPQEAGLEAVAISFSKGCYLGQEVMARLQAMGQVRRRLRRVAGQGERPKRGGELIVAGRRVGEIRAAVAVGSGWEGLAMLSDLILGEARRVEGPTGEVEVSRE